MKLPARYTKIGAPFSGGGMSTAFRCNDSHLEREVLVKALQDGVDQKRMMDEVQALSSVRSKHVVQIYDVIKNDNGKVIALVEEYLPGPDLNINLPIQNLDLYLKHIFAIACGLADVHAVKVVHRDIKPNNMKIDAEGCLRIFDFGLSRKDGVDSETIGTVGTPGYLAPELCVVGSAKVKFTTAVDVFAYGSTALKLIRGKLPKELRAIPPVLPAANSDFSKQAISLPTEISNILNSCLAASPNDRPDISTVRDLIGKYLLEGKHKATMIVNGKLHFLENKGQAVTLSAGSLGSLNVTYDGHDFIVINATGAVSVNNLPILIPQRLPGACVIILGGPELGPKRQYITFDVTHPEVVL